MMIQLILTFCFLLIAIYGWAHIRKMRLVSAGMVLLSVVAIYFIWDPAVTVTLAHLLGIGRGADLVMYFFFVFVVFQLIVLHVKLRAQMSLITQLARRIAIDAAQVPEKSE
jgi:small membrane protein